MAWDMAVLMPSGGAEARSEQSGALERMIHERYTSQEFQDAVERASLTAQSEEEIATVRILRREIGQRTRIPSALVARKSKVTSDAYVFWKTAKPKGDFPALRPHLEEIFEIEREVAHLVGTTQEPYDGLLDMFEEGSTTADARRMFDGIKQPIVDLVQEITQNGKPVNDQRLIRDWDQAALTEALRQIVIQIGFDFRKGRLDLAGNAFCGGTSPTDIRMTTRPSEHIKGVLSSSLHEMGHALYEQNMPTAWFQSPLCGGASHALHESQSRLWENIIGRSEPFWQGFFPQMSQAFPFLEELGIHEFVRALNKVQPELIRVGADELTYNLHILIRFELEVELINRRLEVKNLPDAWNQKYQDYLGLTPPHAGLGCIQDVHWQKGLVGYFPTYAMGNLIGAQIWEVLQSEIPETEALMRKRDLAPILGWLTDKIYSKGMLYPPVELVERTVGGPMSPDPWLKYAKHKYSGIYGLSG